MDKGGCSLFTVYSIKYSNGVVFYWTVWNGHHRVPLIKYGDMFVPVKEHHTKILLAEKVVAISELRMKGEHPKNRENEEGVQAMVFGTEFSCQSEIEWG